MNEQDRLVAVRNEITRLIADALDASRRRELELRRRDELHIAETARRDDLHVAEIQRRDDLHAHEMATIREAVHTAIAGNSAPEASCGQRHSIYCGPPGLSALVVVLG